MTIIHHCTRSRNKRYSAGMKNTETQNGLLRGGQWKPYVAPWRGGRVAAKKFWLRFVRDYLNSFEWLCVNNSSVMIQASDKFTPPLHTVNIHSQFLWEYLHGWRNVFYEDFYCVYIYNSKNLQPLATIIKSVDSILVQFFPMLKNWR